MFETAHDQYAEQYQRAKHRLGVDIEVKHEQRKDAESDDYAVEYVHTLQGGLLFVSIQNHIVRVLRCQMLLFG